MAIQLCDDCGDTLPVTAHEKVQCDCCGKTNQRKVSLFFENMLLQYYLGPD